VAVTGPPGSEAQEKRQAARRQGIAYQGAVEAFVSILIALGAGYWADWQFGTSPLFLLIGLVLGFGAFVLRLARLNRQLKRIPTEPNQTSPPDRDLR